MVLDFLCTASLSMFLLTIFHNIKCGPCMPRQNPPVLIHSSLLVSLDGRVFQMAGYLKCFSLFALQGRKGSIVCFSITSSHIYIWSTYFGLLQFNQELSLKMCDVS